MSYHTYNLGWCSLMEDSLRCPDVVVGLAPGPHVEPPHRARWGRTVLLVQQDKYLLGPHSHLLNMFLYLLLYDRLLIKYYWEIDVVYSVWVWIVLNI